MKTIAITGASGFVGKYLTKYFVEEGYVVLPILRSELTNQSKLQTKLEESDVLINLAGANIIGRWSASYKKVLYNSRIETTRALVEAMKQIENRPQLFVSTSAVGIYKSDKVYDEYSRDYADTFLGNLVDDWEEEANRAKELGMRVAILRFGIVLGKEGGALEKMLTPFKLGFGGIIGDGKQAFSFIHIEDLARFYLYLIENEALEGVYNMTTAKPTTNRGLTKALGKVLKRPTCLPLPTFLLELIYGEGATVLTEGQTVVPQRVLESGFEYKFEGIDEVLEAIIK